MAQEKFYTVKMLAQLFIKHENTIYRWIVNDKLFPHALRVKDGWFIPSSDVGFPRLQNLRAWATRTNLSCLCSAVLPQSHQDQRSRARPPETPRAIAIVEP